MEFCNKCGSLKVNSSCTNKKCDNHIKSMVEFATPQQIEYIKELADQLVDDISEINFESLSKSEAADLIDEYLEKLDESESKITASTDSLDDDLINDEDEE